MLNSTNDFRAASYFGDVIPINATGSTGTLEVFENKVVYYKSNNSVVPQTAGNMIYNRFIVSSNITGAINSSGQNIYGNTSTDKIYAHGLFYTPMSFAGQYGTFWLNMAMNLASASGMGLWTVPLPRAPDLNTFPMTYRESETYTWHQGGSDEAFRWRAKFEVGYPKVSGKEQAWYDTESGVLYEYYTEQTRVDARIGGEFRENLHPQSLRCYLTSVGDMPFGANATAEVPGFPIFTLLIALGIGFALVYRKYRK